jgi:ribonuclease P/MRP protein subunit POP1
MPIKTSDSEKGSSGQSLKRKEAPQSSADIQTANSIGRAPKRAKVHDARTIATQTSDAALSNGELDLQAFLKAREFEIKALEDGLQRSKGALTRRAFQQVPRDMRRRTASHNVKRVPKRLQKRAGKEMEDDNTPTVVASKRKPSNSRGRIRAETARRLGLLSKKKTAAKAQAKTGAGGKDETASEGVVGRTPRLKVRKGTLNEPPKPASKFRKRQIHKTWLPTHMYHAKRSKMTEPAKPLWRFAIPLTPTEKSYRPTHRAGGARGAVCWDMSYMSTIGLEGTEQSIEKVLRLMGVISNDAWGKPGQKWREGKRVRNEWMSRDCKSGRKQIGPVTIIWCADGPKEPSKKDTENPQKNKKPLQRRVVVRVHPSAFLELWNEILRVSKMQRPVVHAEDLRFEIGSIEMTGPGSTEALLGILYPYDDSTNPASQAHAQVFRALGGVTNSASLPPNALLSFSIQDPRLHYPPRKADLPRYDDEEAVFSLLQTLSTWPVDQYLPSPSFFDRDTRFKATRLPSQKSLNRRKGLATPGEYPTLLATDPKIPILLYATHALSSRSAQGTWTLLAPWKCVLPIWYGLVHYPLSSGGNPRFCGLQELRQIHFEQGKPWFPADYPGTDAGWAWEMNERQRRKAEWDRRPKGKRTEFASLDLGTGRRGEIGLGWACDFERLIKPTSKKQENKKEDARSTEEKTEIEATTNNFQHLPGTEFSLLSNPKLDVSPMPLAAVRITLISRGVPTACARIYRLPSGSPSLEPILTSQPLVTQAPLKSGLTPPTSSLAPTLREQWISLAHILNTKSQAKPNKQRPPLSAIPASKRSRALAEMLLDTPSTYPASPPTAAEKHPVVPDENDLIGFVTTGNFNLAIGKATAIGSIWAAHALESVRAGAEKGRESRLCIVRNSGESVGRLGVWEVV